MFIEYARTNLQGNTHVTVSLADAAPLPTSPARPKPTLYTLLAAILGLGLGLAAALPRPLRPPAAHVRGRRGQVRHPGAGARAAARALGHLGRRVPRGVPAAATNLQFAGQDERLGALAITSGRQDEGKTTTVTQLALASAEVGLRVIVVEADFRRPKVQRELVPEREEPLRPGFSNYLVEAASLEDVIHPTGRPNISIVPAGPLPPSPSALLESRRGQRAVSDFLSRADLVLLDCPPLSVGADASVIAGWVDGVILVVDLAGSTDRTVRDGLRQLESVRANLLGLVLNRDPGAEPSSYDYYLSVDAGTRGGGSGGGGKRELARPTSRRP